MEKKKKEKKESAFQTFHYFNPTSEAVLPNIF